MQQSQFSRLKMIIVYTNREYRFQTLAFVHRRQIDTSCVVGIHFQAFFHFEPCLHMLLSSYLEFQNNINKILSKIHKQIYLHCNANATMFMVKIN